MEICTKMNCTGCGACAFRCPKNCIAMKENETGIIYPIVDDTQCIQCNQCKTICPQNNSPDFRKPMLAYAAWSADKEERRTSASGGVAAELYRLALKENSLITGAVSEADFSVSHIITDQESVIKDMKNSKYVFSEMYELYPRLAAELKSGHHVTVIALPCQIAAIQNLFPDRRKQMLLVDVVCHGVTPYLFLQQHINMLEEKCGKQAVKMSFRDPDADTYTFTFTLYDKDGTRICAQRTIDGDTYQYGYHRMISYRENCYHCQYARSERVSDITLSDYKGLGKLAPCSYGEQKVSSVLIHTEEGRKWVDKLIKAGKIIAEERPIEEPINGDAQLRHPSGKSKARNDFEKYIVLNHGDFEKTMSKVLEKETRRKKYNKVFHGIRMLKQKWILKSCFHIILKRKD